MKKEFVIPAVRVIKIESNIICDSPTVTNELGNGVQEAPTRYRGIFGEDSDF